jgi:O-antigen/teichoic acid export membrane protein
MAFEDMKYISYLSVIRTLVSVLLMVIFLYLGYGVMAMIVILVLTNVGVVILNLCWTRKYLRFRFFSKIRIQKATLRQGITFSAIQFLNTLSGRIDLVMLSFLTTPAGVGVYALGSRLIQKSGIFRVSLMTAFFPALTKHFEEKNARAGTFFKQTLYLFTVLLLGAVAVYFICPVVIPAVFGEKFRESVRIIQVLCFSLVFSYSVMPFGLALQTTYNERIILFIGIVRAIFNISLNLLLFYKMGIVGIAYSTLITLGVRGLLVVYFGYSTLKRQKYFV